MTWERRPETQLVLLGPPSDFRLGPFANYRLTVIHSVRSLLNTANADLNEIAQKYAGSKAALEAGSNYFTIYDRLDEELDVTLANPPVPDWLEDQKQKDDCKDTKNLARFLRLGEVPESYVPPKEFQRALARGRKKLVDKCSDFKNEVNFLLDQNGVSNPPATITRRARAMPATATRPNQPLVSVPEMAEISTRVTNATVLTRISRVPQSWSPRI